MTKTKKGAETPVQDSPAETESEIDQVQDAPTMSITIDDVSALCKVPDTLGHKWGTKNEVHLGVFKAAMQMLGFGGKLSMQTADNTIWRFLVERMVHHTMQGGSVTISADGIQFDGTPISVQEWLAMSDADWKEFLQEHDAL